MSNPNDGGPAFPQSISCATGEAPRASYDFVDGSGMSLRDYFAAEALHISAWQVGPNATDHFINDAANTAYRLADAMLRARAAKSPRETQDAHLETFGTEGHGQS